MYSVPASFLTMVKLFWLCAADVSPSSPSEKPQSNIQSPKKSSNYSLENALPCKCQSLDVQSHRPGAVRLFLCECLASLLHNAASCSRVSPTLMPQDAFYIIDTHMELRASLSPPKPPNKLFAF